MKRYIGTLTILCIVASMANTQIMYRPMEWHTIEDSTKRYTIYFPKGSELPASIANEQMQKIIPFFAENFFVSVWPRKSKNPIVRAIEKLALGVVPGTAQKDSMGKVILDTIAYHPEHINIFIYQNAEDLNEQKLAYTGRIPPGVAGFTETTLDRVAIPWTGNRHWFTLVLAHELFHVFTEQYLKDRGKTNNLLNFFVSERPSNNMFPLWFIEGTAEYAARAFMASIGEGNNMRNARSCVFNRMAVYNNAVPQSPIEFKYISDFRNYTLAPDFVAYSISKTEKKETLIPDIIDTTIYTNNSKIGGDNNAFTIGWQHAFNKPIAHMYDRWYNNLFAAYAEHDTIRNDALVKKQFLKFREPLLFIGSVDYDPRSRIMAGYISDEKWGLTIAALVNDSILVPLEHQFSDKQVYYRTWNTPSVHGRSVAFSVTKEGKDYIKIYTIIGNDKPIVQLTQILSLPEHILWAEHLMFVSSAILLFVGMDIKGTKDIFWFNLYTYKWGTVTTDNNEREEKLPHTLGKSIAYIASDGNEREDLYCAVRDADATIEIKKITFGAHSLLHLFISHNNIAVIHALNANGTSELIFWEYDTEEAYQLHLAYTAIENIIGWNERGRLFALTYEEKLSWNERLVTITVDTAALEKIPVTIEVIKHIVRSDSLIRHTDRIARRAQQFPRFSFANMQENGGGGVTFEDPTGEHSLSIFAVGGWNKMFGWSGYGEIHFYDFSKRLIRITGIEGGRYYNMRVPFWMSIKALSLDAYANLREIVIWPLDIENSIATSFGIGYMKRQYVFAPQNSFSLPTFTNSIAFISSAVFADYMSGVKHGHRYLIGIQSTSLVNIKNFGILNGVGEMDFRYYLIPWRKHFYIALRWYGATTFGKDPYALFNGDLHRTSGLGFYNVDYLKSIGKNIFLYQAEIRLPLARIFITEYEWWKSEIPAPLSVVATAFIYGGGITWDYKTPPFVHRWGYTLNIGFFIPTVFLRIEWYKYISEKKWNTAIGIGQEF